MAIVSDRALVLKRYPFSESSLVVHLCTHQHGRVHLLAKGAYRPTSRYFAVLDFLDTLELEWDHNPNRELANLRSGSILRRRRAIPDDSSRWTAAGAMFELTELASRPAHPDPPLFELLEGGLDELEAAQARTDAALVAFELRYLGVLGISPALVRCAACGGSAPPSPSSQTGTARVGGARAAFSAGAGGRLCAPCSEEARASGRRVGTLPVETLEDAHAFLESGAAVGDELPRDRVERVQDFAGRFLDYHLEIRPRIHRALLLHGNRNSRNETAEAV